MDLNNSFTENSSDNTNTSVTTLYYGVYTPNEGKDFNAASCVFQDKIEALKLVKKNKKSRFKAFQFYHEAAEFALNGSEFPNNNTSVDGPLFQKKVLEAPQTFNEKVSPFKGPKPQELVELRKNIEVGNIRQVRNTIWQNPRYLVSSGDTPSILQEGARYNALHVGAKAKNAPIVELILSTISNVEFIKLLYGDDNQANAEERIRMLLDLYLNTPNKGLNETPLHFAAKYGAVDVVEILVSYPQCDKTLKNKFGKTANEIVCQGSSNSSAEDKKKIDLLLEDGYYVPVLRFEDNSMPPLIGEPFSPTSPPVLNENPLSPRLEIHAYAGPLNKKSAQNFRRVWKTPPRSLLNALDSKESKEILSNVAKLKYKDPEKGLERLGKNLAKQYDICWKEYWPFLDSFIDIASEEGLNLLDNHLAVRFTTSSDNIRPIECVKKAVSPNFTELSPVSNLCATMQACTLNDSTDSCNIEMYNGTTTLGQIIHIERACQVFATRIFNDMVYNLCNEYNNLAAVLEIEIKQLELLVASYLDDRRFSNMNFQKVHSYVGALVGEKLYHSVKEEIRLLETFLEDMTKSLDCFSSDDEGVHLKEASEVQKPTSHKRQLICLIQYILNYFTQNLNDIQQIYHEEVCQVEWEKAKECPCVFKKTKKSIFRNSSIKYNSKYSMRLDVEITSRKLDFGEDKDEFVPKMALSDCILSNEFNCDYSSDEDFVTPPSSPIMFNGDDSSSDEEFDDALPPRSDVFIEGDRPSKTDFAVFNALKYSECSLSDKKHPHVYRWHHSISLYDDTERENWPSPSKIRKTNSLVHSLTLNSSPPSTPSKSWVRITGANSPRAVFKSNNTFIKA